MQIFSLCAAVWLFLPSVLSSESKEQPKELIVDVLHIPESCDTKAATGDKISMHYVCFSFQLLYLRCCLLQYYRLVPCFRMATNLTPRTLWYLIPSGELQSEGAFDYLFG